MEKLTRKLKTINIHNKQYVEVKERILALVESWLPYAINTEHWYYPERKMWVVKATLTMVDTMESFTWLAQEIEANWNINATSALENAETSAVGRACAFAWIGIIDWIASVDEINKATNRQVDTPTWWKKEYPRTEADELLDQMTIVETEEQLKVLFAKLYPLGKSDKQKWFYKAKYEEAKDRIVDSEDVFWARSYEDTVDIE